MSHIPSQGNQATQLNKRRRYHHHNGTCQHGPKRNPPKTRLGNGRVLVNGAGRGSDAVQNFMKSEV